MAKDKNAPKRAMSAWMLFCNAKRASVQRKHSDLKMTEISGVLAKMWKNVSASEKKHFDAEAAKEKKKYQAAMKKYKASPAYAAHQDQSKVINLLKKVCKKHGLKAPRGKKAKFPKDENAPKRASSSFFLWSNDNRQKLMAKHNNSVSEVGKALGAGWKSISADVKAKYESKANKAKAAYTSQLNKYKKSKNFKSYEAAKSEFNKLKKKL